jgi:hypothetical protein
MITAFVAFQDSIAAVLHKQRPAAPIQRKTGRDHLTKKRTIWYRSSKYSLLRTLLCLKTQVKLL